MRPLPETVGFLEGAHSLPNTAPATPALSLTPGSFGRLRGLPPSGREHHTPEQGPAGLGRVFPTILLGRSLISGAKFFCFLQTASAASYNFGWLRASSPACGGSTAKPGWGRVAGGLSED